MKLGKWSDSPEKLPENEKEWMVWTLDAMKRASMAREEHYRLKEATRDQIIALGSSVPLDLLQMLQVDSIFALVRAIECFLGATAVAWGISTGVNEDDRMKSVHRRLLRPDPLALDEVRSILSKETIKKNTLCKLCGFPVPEDLGLEQKDETVLWEVYDQTLKRMKVVGSFAVDYWREYKSVRDVYAHNTRILFLQSYLTGEKPPEEFSVFGLLDADKRRPGSVILLCDTQRKAMKELMARISELERVLYDNMIFYVWNDCTPVPPVVAYYVPNRFQDDLQRIKILLGHKWDIPAYRVEIKDQEAYERQYHLHKRFLKHIERLGTRK